MISSTHILPMLELISTCVDMGSIWRRVKPTVQLRDVLDIIPLGCFRDQEGRNIVCPCYLLWMFNKLHGCHGSGLLFGSFVVVNPAVELFYVAALQVC